MQYHLLSYFSHGGTLNACKQSIGRYWSGSSAGNWSGRSHAVCISSLDLHPLLLQAVIYIVLCRPREGRHQRKHLQWFIWWNIFLYAHHKDNRRWNTTPETVGILAISEAETSNKFYLFQYIGDYLLKCSLISLAVGFIRAKHILNDAFFY